MSYEQEDDELNEFIRGELEKEITLTEYLQRTQTNEKMLDLFLDGYLYGDMKDHFKELNNENQRAHLEVLNLAMIIARKVDNDMERYRLLKKVIEELNYL